MFYTGFADEAGKNIDTQIRATKTLGWSNIELRNTGFDGDLATMSDKDFEILFAKIAESGIKINCFGSAIANWSKDICAPFEDTLKDIKRCIPRLHRLGTNTVRIMSYAIRKDPKTNKPLPIEEQHFEERAKRLKEIVHIFESEGITPLHENCMNYGGFSWKHTLQLIEAVPNLKLVFDTGNPVFSDDMSKEPDQNGERSKQDAWEFYSHVKKYIHYVHIKDAYLKEEKTKDGIQKTTVFTYPGEGNGKVPEIIEDLLRNGYDGGLSIEPHLQYVFHEDNQDAKEQAMFDSYIEYGKRLMKIVDNIKAKIK